MMKMVFSNMKKLRFSNSLSVIQTYFYLRSLNNSSSKFNFSNSNNHDDTQKNDDSQTSKTTNTQNTIDNNEDGRVTINYKDFGGARQGDTEHYAILFTCTKCDTRNKKMFTKKAYHHGIVVIRCDGCDGLHLIADNLGWVNKEKINIEDIAKEKGISLKKLKADGLFNME